MNDKVILEPIGILYSEMVDKYETPHQGILESSIISEIRLNPHRNFEQAVKDLDGFDRLWIIYLFHKSMNWKPLVNPPRLLGKKVGVFASRSPHRPNQIGLSCVKLVRVEGLKILISESDILDGTPILDIKPYLPYSDSFPGSATGWVKTELQSIFSVIFDKEAEAYAIKLKNEQKVNLFSYAKIQLEFNPTDTLRKRISVEEDGKYILDYQKWHIHYNVNEKEKIVLIKAITVSAKQ